MDNKPVKRVQMQPGSLFLARKEKWVCDGAQYAFLFLAFQPLIVLSSPQVSIVFFFLTTFFSSKWTIVRQTLNDKLEQHGMSSSSLPYYVSLRLLTASVCCWWTSKKKPAVEKHLLCTEQLDQLLPLSSCRKFLIAVGMMPPDSDFILIWLNLYNCLNASFVLSRCKIPCSSRNVFFLFFRYILKCRNTFSHWILLWRQLFTLHHTTLFPDCFACVHTCTL